MSSVRKLVSGKWQVAIRRKDQPAIYKTFKEKGLASKYGKEFEAQKEIIEKLNREINKIKSVKRKV